MKWYSISDASRMTNTARQSFYNWIRMGRLSAKKMNNTRWAISELDIKRVQNGELDFSTVSTVRESKVEQDVSDSIIGCIPVKLKDSTGIPDRMYILPEGIVAFIEFKRPRTSEQRKGQTRIHQKRWVEKLESLGHHVRICSSAKDAVDWLVSLGATPK